MLMIPEWYILQKPANLEINVKEWSDLAWQRIQLLEEFIKDPSLAVRTHFPVYDPSLEQMYQNYRIGAYFLRLVAANNRRIESWLIETEGDLFSFLYRDRTDGREDRITLFQEIFGLNNVMHIQEFLYQFGEQSNENIQELQSLLYARRHDFLICVHFTQVPAMVSRRRGYLRRGWVIDLESGFHGSLKKAFEKQLQQQIVEARDLLGIRQDIDATVDILIKKITKHIQLRTHYTDELIGDFSSQPQYFPPCMACIYNEFISTGRLTHNLRLQLAFYLKKIGMTLEDQLQFWWEKSVDNAAMTYDTFLRKAGYQIRHTYGLEGGKKDYDVPKCKTIATTYFCPFVSYEITALSKFLQALIPDEIDEKELIKLATGAANFPTRACTWTFQQIYDFKPKYPIYHPLQWTREAVPKEEKEEKKDVKQK